MTTKETYRNSLIDHFNQNFKNSGVEAEVWIVERFLIINLISPILNAKFISYKLDSYLDDGPHHEYFRKLEATFMNQFKNHTQSFLMSCALAEIDNIRVDIGKSSFITHKLNK